MRVLFLLIYFLGALSAVQADQLTYEPIDGPVRVVSLTNVNSATPLTLPARSYILAIIAECTTVNTVTGGLKYGTTLGGSDIISSLTTVSQGLSYSGDVAISKRIFSLTNSQTIYVDARTAWNSATVNTWIIYKTIP